MPPSASAVACAARVDGLRVGDIDSATCARRRRAARPGLARARSRRDPTARRARRWRRAAAPRPDRCPAAPPVTAAVRPLKSSCVHASVLQVGDREDSNAAGGRAMQGDASAEERRQPIASAASATTPSTQTRPNIVLRVSLWNMSMSSISSATCALVATATAGSANRPRRTGASHPGATSIGRIITKCVTDRMRCAWLSHALTPLSGALAVDQRRRAAVLLGLSGVDEELVGQPTGIGHAHQHARTCRWPCPRSTWNLAGASPCRRPAAARRPASRSRAARCHCRYATLADAQHAHQVLETTAGDEFHRVVRIEYHLHHKDAVLVILDDQPRFRRLESHERHRPRPIVVVYRPRTRAAWRIACPCSATAGVPRF